MTICVAAAPVAPVCAIIICDSASPSTSAPYMTPMGMPTMSCARITDQRGRHISVRAISPADLAAQEQHHRQRHANDLRDVRAPGRPLHAHAELEDEDLVEDGVGDGSDHHHGHREAHRGDAVEEAHRRPAHRADERAAHARLPVFERQRFDVRIETEGMQQQAARRRPARGTAASARARPTAHSTARASAYAPRRLP